MSSAKEAVDLLVLTGMLGQYLEYSGREQHLVYGVVVSYAPYRDHFDIVIECSVETSKTGRMLHWFFDSMRSFKNELNLENLKTYRENFVKTSRMELPNPKSTLENLSWYYYYFGQPLTTEQEIELIKNVELDDLVTLFETLFEGSTSTLQIAGQITEELKRSVESLYTET